MAGIQQEVSAGTVKQRVIGKLHLTVIALGGGRAETIIDSYIRLKGSRIATGGGPAKETAGEATVPIPADLSKKFRQTFEGGLTPQAEDELNCTLTLDTGFHKYYIDFGMIRQDDRYQHLSRWDMWETALRPRHGLRNQIRRLLRHLHIGNA